VLWHLWILLVAPLDPTVSRAVHVFLGAALGFAAVRRHTPRRAARGGLVDWLLIAACLPFRALHNGCRRHRDAHLHGAEHARHVAFAVGILIVLEFARRTAGLAMPIIAGVFIAYIFVGPWMPGILYHRGVPFGRRCLLFNNNGVLGTIVQVSSTFIIMFVTFAAFLQASARGRLLQRARHGLVGWARGGQAKVAVRLLLHVRHHLRQLGGQCRGQRHLHHPDDAPRRLRPRDRGRGRGHQPPPAGSSRRR
jgi:TRAP-type uncharacterized transport system fused permease subunit